MAKSHVKARDKVQLNKKFVGELRRIRKKIVSGTAGHALLGRAIAGDSDAVEACCDTWPHLGRPMRP